MVLTGLPEIFGSDRLVGINRINPLETDGMNAAIVYRLRTTKPDDAEKLRQLAADAKRSAASAPIDANVLALYAETLFAKGDANEGIKFANLALQLDPTNRVAIQRVIVSGTDPASYRQSVEHLDARFRRNPKSIVEFKPILAALLANQTGFEALRDLLAQKPSWSLTFFDQLLADEENLSQLPKLILELHNLDPNANRRAVSLTVSKLLTAGEYQQAHRLFIFTKSENDEALNGYIFNRNLTQPKDGSPFNWTYASNQSASIEWQKVGKTDGRLRVGFLDKPLKHINLSQNFILPGGSYELTINMDGEGLKLPKPVGWRLICLRPNRTIATLPIEQGTYEAKTLTATFDVVSNECEMFRLSTYGRSNVKNYNERFSGQFYLNSVDLKRMAAASNG